MPFGVVASASDSIKTFGVSWKKFVTGKSLDRTQVAVIKGSCIISVGAIFVSMMIGSLVALVKIERDFARAIQTHDNEAVRHNIQRVMQSARGLFVWYAIYNKNHEALKILLDCGAKPDHYVFGIFRSPLCVALARDDFESAHLLLDHGADPLFQLGGIRALDYAYKNEELAKKMRDKVSEKEANHIAKFEGTFCNKHESDTNNVSFFARIKRNMASFFTKKKKPGDEV